MKRFPTLTAALLLAGLAAVPALAGSNQDSALESQLSLYQFDVDATSLSDVQKARLQAALHSSDSAQDRHSEIYSILN